MLKDFDSEQIKKFDKKVIEVFTNFVTNINEDEYLLAAKHIIETEKQGNRIHITGIGKPGHVASYGASLLSSVGTATYFLHGTEAVHGSCGQLLSGDLVICISNSGETAELKETIKAIKNNNCKVISITGNKNSWLAKEALVNIFAGVKEEGDNLNRAPRASILAENFVLQRLSLILQEYKKLTPEQYIKWHPGGALGSLRDDEK